MKHRRDQPLVMPTILRPDDPAYPLEVYTPRAAAQYLHVSRATVYLEIAKGALAHRRNGLRGELLCSQRDLDEWREARRPPTTVTAQTLRNELRLVDPVEPLKLPRRRMFS